MKTAEHKSAYRRNNSGLWYALLFIVLVGVLWIFWNAPYSRSPIKVEIDPSINTADGRIDYDRFIEVSTQIGTKLYIPGEITIMVESCEVVNAYYDVGSSKIIICDEIIDDFNQKFAKVYKEPELISESSTNALLFITLHELGHVLMDVLDIPFTGKEEDAADQLSTYLLLRNVINGAEYVLDGATWFGVTSEEYELEESDFGGEHSLDAQRYYTLACWIYGADPAVYGDIILEGGLDPDRAELCKDEYEILVKNWTILLDDYIR